MYVLGFWNNKGGTGKTSLIFQATCAFAKQNMKHRILVLDVCPQANLSELMLGGQENGGGKNLLNLYKQENRRSIGGYFQSRLPKPYDHSSLEPSVYLSQPNKYNNAIPENITLLAGDPLLELQANAVSTLANTQIPGTDSWSSVSKWLLNFLDACPNDFNYCFVDMNPSFSMYTQIALATCDRLVLPVTADDASRRGIQNVMSLIYGLKLPTDVYSRHNFSSHMEEAKLKLPKIHLVTKNRLTQYIRTAKGYVAVLSSITNDLKTIIKENPSFFTFSDVKEGIIEIKDFQTSGVVAFALGRPFVTMNARSVTIAGEKVGVDSKQLKENREIIVNLADKLWS